MSRCCRRLCGALALLFAFAPLRAHEEWFGFHIGYSANFEFVYPFDGRTPKTAVALLYHHDSVSPTAVFTFSVNGVRPAGAGFATFPDGGGITVAAFDFGLATALTGGIYDGTVTQPPAVGASKDYTFQFVFALAPGSTPPAGPLVSVNPDPENNNDPPGTQTTTVRFTNLGDNPVLAGPFSFNGTLRFPTINGSPPAANALVEVATPYSNWFRVSTIAAPSGAGPAISFSQSLPVRNDWHVRFSADGYETRVIPLGSPFDPRGPLDVTLTPAAPPDLDYRRIAAIATPTGFWRGAVSESEGTFVCFPGQENWKAGATDADNRALRSAGRVYKYKFDGTKLWEHAPGWEIWGGDMTPDGRYAAYALNPTASGFYTPAENKLVLLDGVTGAVLWTKSAAPSDPAVGRKLDSLEVALSPDAKWIAIGSTAGGQVTLVDRATGNFLWSVPGAAPTFGQVRKLRFSADSQFLYCGSGDSSLRKLRVSDGAVLWRTTIGGWPSVNGLDLSPDGAWVAIGAKSLDAAVIRASDGRPTWFTETQALDAVFSPDGRLVATAGGHIFRTSDGTFAGMAKLSALSRFTPDGRWLLKLDRSFTLHDLGGKQLKNFGDTGLAAGQAQWAHLTRDGRYAVVLARDLAAPPSTGIVIFERSPNAAANAPVITAPPLSQPAATGAAATLSVTATGTAPLGYQWRKNGADLPGATSAALSLAAVSAADVASYTCVVTNAAGSVTSAAAALGVVAPDATNPARLSNLAVRSTAGPGASALIVGFTLGGSGSAINKRVLLRGAGPSLAAFNVTGALADPRLTLLSGNTVLASNDNWAGDAQVAALATQVGAFPFAGAASKDAALAALPVPGSYTMFVASGDATSGLALAEIYDGSSAFTADTPRLINVSARNDTGGAAGPLIAGFVVAGPAARTVLVRGIGPALAQFGVTTALADPQLALFRDAAQIAANDNWYDAPNAVAIATATAQVGAFALPPASRDAALLLSLPPGSYSAVVSGPASAAGNALVEIYEVP